MKLSENTYLVGTTVNFLTLNITATYRRKKYQEGKISLFYASLSKTPQKTTQDNLLHKLKARLLFKNIFIKHQLVKKKKTRKIKLYLDESFLKNVRVNSSSPYIPSMSFSSVNSGSLDDILLISSDFTTWGGLLARDKKHPKVKLLRRWPSGSFGVETVDDFFPCTSARSLIKIKIWIFYNSLLNTEPKHIKIWTNHSLCQKKAWIIYV